MKKMFKIPSPALLAFISMIGFSLTSPTLLAAETLVQAWQQALAHNPTIQAATLQTQATENTLKIATAARLPKIELSAGYTLLDHAPASKVQLGPSQNEMPIGEDKILSYQGSATLPLYTGGRIYQGIQSAKALIQASQSQQAQTEQHLKLEVTQAYLQVLRSQTLSQLADQQVKTLQAHLQDVQNLYQQNLVDRNDLLAAKTKSLDAQQQALQAHNALSLAKSHYNQLLQRPLDTPVELVDLAPVAESRSLAALTNIALKDRPELTQLQSQTQALQAQATQKISATKPQAFLRGGYTYQQNQYQVYEGKWQATLGVSWQVYDGGLTHYGADQLKKQANALQAQAQNLRNQIALQVRQKWLSLQDAQQRIQVTQSGVRQAAENLEVARQRYQAGLSSNTEVLDATTLKLQSDTHAVQARYDAVQAQLELQYAIGHL